MAGNLCKDGSRWYLVAAGANVDARERDGTTALIHASFSGRLELVKVLLAAGANPNRNNHQDGTLINGVKSASKSCGRSPAAADADVRFNGEPALIMASGEGHLKGAASCRRRRGRRPRQPRVDGADQGRATALTGTSKSCGSSSPPARRERP